LVVVLNNHLARDSLSDPEYGIHYLRVDLCTRRKREK
jgi:hypothetical protein